MSIGSVFALVCRLSLSILATVALSIASPASAQGQPFPAPPTNAGWDSTVGPFYDTPDEACLEQMRVQGGPSAVYGGTDATEDWYAYTCSWTGGTSGASGVVFRCFQPWVRVAPGECVIETDQRVSVSCDCFGSQSETPMPIVGKPINLQSGDKVEFERDYATADGLFAVDRFYHSGFRGRTIESPSETAGFGRRWHGLVPGHITVAGTAFNYLEYLPTSGGIETFETEPAQASSFDFVTEAPSRYRVSMVTVPTSSRPEFFRAAANTSSTGEVRVDFPNGDYLLFRRAGPAITTGLGQRTLVPTEHHLASGYTRFFDYEGTNLHPSAIRDSFGRQMLLTWQPVSWRYPCIVLQANTICSRPRIRAQPVITNIVLPDGTSLAYDYDVARRGGGGADDRLVSVQHKRGSTVLHGRTYLYEDTAFPYALTGMLDQLGRRLSTVDYDISGRPESSQHLATVATATEPAVIVNRYQVEHRRIDEARLQRVVTNPLGLVATYDFSRLAFNEQTFLQPRRLDRIEIEGTTLVPTQTRTWGYDNDFVNQIIDGREVTFQRSNDAQGRPTQMRDAFGRSEAQVINLEWQPIRDLLESEERGNLRVEYDYDAQGRMIERREIDVRMSSVPYSTNGQTRTWTYSWLANGRLQRMNGPRAMDAQNHDDTETYGYDAVGNLETVTNGLNQVTRFENFDANGRPERMIDVNNVVTTFDYDDQGRMIEMSVRAPTGTAHATTTFEYDVEHRVTGIIRPDTAKLAFTYDLAGRLISLSSPSFGSINFKLDAMGNVVRQTTGTSDGTQRGLINRTFDELGRMITQTLGPGRTWQFGYDNQDNPTRATSARSFATEQSFDGLARLIRTVHPDTGEDDLGYNTNDELTNFTDPLDVATSTTYNGFGQVIQEVSPDRGTTEYRYTSGGDLESVLDARGQRIDYTHDILGRVTSRTPVGLAAQAVTYAYDIAGIGGSYGVGRLSRIDDGSGSTRFQYDHRGNMAQRKQTIAGASGITTAFAYDLADRISRITYPSGREVDYGRDAQGRVTSVATRANSGGATQTLLSGGTYEPFGALATATFGNGQLYKQARDAYGRLTARRYRNAAGVSLWSVGYGYDADDNITSITDLVDATRTVAYQYDTVDRLSRVDLSTGTTRREDYVHDVGGNRTRVEYRAPVSDTTPASLDTYNRTTGTNRIASITTPAGTRSFTPDARGNLASEDRPGTNDVTVGYDGYARLTSYVRTGEANLAMAYNGMDQRVALTRDGTTRRMVQDGDGRLLGEYAANASQPFSEYVWLLPEAGDAGSFGGDDGMGGWAPLVVATADGTGGATMLHWMQTDHLGRPVASYDVNSNPTTLPATTTALAYPGQQQTLADLYYNHYRDYDPSTGRYIQADPIGLAGDVNPFVYARANAIGRRDPQGLNVVLITWYKYGVGGHSALYVTGPNGNRDRGTLIDPSGGFRRRDNYAQMQRPGGMVFDQFGYPTTLDQYLRYQSEGWTYRLIELSTSSAQDQRIIELADQIGDPRGFNCASTSSELLRSIPSLGDLYYSLPGSLADAVAQSQSVISDEYGTIPEQDQGPPPCTLMGCN